MNFSQYQAQAMSFRKLSADATYALLNLPGEVGELLSLEAKARRDGPKEDFLVQAKKELGDIMWCLAAVAEDFGFDLEDIAQTNIDKLTGRKERGTLDGSGDDR